MVEGPECGAQINGYTECKPVPELVGTRVETRDAPPQAPDPDRRDFAENVVDGACDEKSDAGSTDGDAVAAGRDGKPEQLSRNGKNLAPALGSVDADVEEIDFLAVTSKAHDVGDERPDRAPIRAVESS